MHRIQTQLFGHTTDGQPVYLYTLANAAGISVKIISFGGIITSITTPDRSGNFDDVVLGYDTLAEYEACERYLGCITGRFANRIANGEFTLDGITYSLTKNLGEHHLHSAEAGFNKVVWQPATRSGQGAASLTLSYTSVDGHGGYPGTLSVEVLYTLNDENELIIDYTATTDQPTVVNLTNHSYFNLRGHQYAERDGVLDHELQLAASKFVPTDRAGIPSGFYSEVAGTPLDFRRRQRIGARIEEDHPQLLAGSGYDHTWIQDIDRAAGALIATVHEPVSGRELRVRTNQPGVQFYTANHIGEKSGKSGALYQTRGSLCLETQHPGDSPNQPEFPSTVLRPGVSWNRQTVYQFDIAEK